MKNSFTLFLGILVVAVLLAYMVTFTVRYDEVAVLTTFDKATPPTRDAAGNITDPGSLRIEPGLYFKAPWPFQSQRTYSKRVHILEDQLEEQQTADGYAVIVQTYLAWRIDEENPLDFFINLENEDRAQKQLLDRLRNVRGVIAKYRFDQLVNTDESKLKLEQIEKECADLLRNQLAQAQQNYGIKIEQLGIRRVVLPEKVTEVVAERMKVTRKRMAADARGQGTAAAATIKSEATTARARILAQAERRASSLRKIGDAEAISYYTSFSKNPDLAKFIKRIETMEKFLPHNTTIILSAEQWGLDSGISADGGPAPFAKEAAAPVTLPAVEGPKRRLALTLRPAQQFELDGAVVSDAALDRALEQAAAGPGTVSVSLSLNADVKYEVLADLMSRLKRAGVDDVQLQVTRAARNP